MGLFDRSKGNNYRQQREAAKAEFDRQFTEELREFGQQIDLRAIDTLAALLEARRDGSQVEERELKVELGMRFLWSLSDHPEFGPLVMESNPALARAAGAATDAFLSVLQKHGLTPKIIVIPHEKGKADPAVISLLLKQMQQENGDAFKELKALTAKVDFDWPAESGQKQQEQQWSKLQTVLEIAVNLAIQQQELTAANFFRLGVKYGLDRAIYW